MAGERIAGLAGKVAEAITRVEEMVDNLEGVATKVTEALEVEFVELKEGLANLKQRFAELEARLAEGQKT